MADCYYETRVEERDRGSRRRGPLWYALLMTCRSALQRILWVSVALVSGAGLAVELLRPLCHLSGQRGLVPLLSLSYEGNLPTWFSSALLLCAAALLGLIAADVRQRGERHGRALVTRVGLGRCVHGQAPDDVDGPALELRVG